MGNDSNEMPRVLLVEDAPYLRYALGRLLSRAGFEVREARDGRDALAIVNDFNPDLVVTDIQMPIMDGVELIRRLRDDPRTANLPILAMTADCGPRTEALAKDAGAGDLLIKPVDLSHLIERMRVLGREG